MIFFEDAFNVADDFMRNRVNDYDAGDRELLEEELEQKRWIRCYPNTVEKQCADTCRMISVDEILEAIKEERLNEYVKEVKANIYGIAAESREKRKT